MQQSARIFGEFFGKRRKNARSLFLKILLTPLTRDIATQLNFLITRPWCIGP